jgi:DNA ligase (NAD+)
VDIQQTILALREELNQHNHNYYVLDNPTISDFDFDKKLQATARFRKSTS